MEGAKEDKEERERDQEKWSKEKEEYFFFFFLLPWVILLEEFAERPRLLATYDERYELLIPLCIPL